MIELFVSMERCALMMETCSSFADIFRLLTIYLQDRLEIKSQLPFEKEACSVMLLLVNRGAIYRVRTKLAELRWIEINHTYLKG